MTNKFRDCGPPVHDKELDEFETRLGVRLPAGFRERYKTGDGGRPQKRIFLDADGNDFEVKSFRRLVHKIPGEPLIEDTYKMLALQRGIVPKRLLPFASDSGGDLYAVDLATGAVWFWAADAYKAGKPESAATQIAPSLDAFIAGMVTERKAYG